ncbi:dihydroorotase [Nonlabens sp.]|uniref:dihydroorotase n=1 Tax=Nonlabens sp. TaxID=1888209 RepID=UPI0025E32EC9|nr:dihydroorotase [Nonlabens sp.]
MIKRIVVTLFFSLSSLFVYSQNINSSIKIGDVFVIGEGEHANYQYINFPRPNFIIKKGGIPNFKEVIGKKVEVTSIQEKKDGSLIATIKLASNTSFFNSHKYVTVAISKAIHEKELVKI